MGALATGAVQRLTRMSWQFGRDVRLRSSREFKAVQERGSRASMRYLTMLARPNSLGRDRLGIIASRRVGGAVVRNRAKRRLREIFRQDAPDMARATSYDFVVIARAELVEAPLAAVQADFRAAVRRLRRERPA